MLARTPQLAKLTRPKLHDVIARERLFHVLDDSSRTRPVTWIESPPGAGKTTLVASYLEARSRPGIWFQVDPGDNDPATFFYYLGLAERILPSRRKRRPPPLPLLTPELLGDVPGFSRRFFRELFSRLPAGSVVVFDNFQEAADNAAMHEALVAGIDEVPDGIHLMVVSRAGTPPHYARLNANRAVTVIDWEALRFTPEETTELIDAARLEVEPAAIEALREQAGGWAVGLVLLAEQLRRGGSLAGADDPESLQHVFAYFAGQMFDRASETDRRLLMQLSFPQSVSEALAREITGTEDAVRLLEYLYKRHLFTDRRRGREEAAYQFHALFRAFLQERARRDLSPQHFGSMARQVARLLARRGQADAAMPLFLAGGDEAGAEALVLAEASALLAQGRWKVVVDWIHGLPASHVHANPWLLYWLGTAQAGVDPAHARDVLARAHRRALALGDLACQIQAGAGIVETLFLEYADFMPIDPWIPVLERILDPGFTFRSLDEELRAQSALLIATTYRMPDHPGIERCARRAMELLDTGADLNLRVSAATHLTLHGAFTGQLELSCRAARRLVPLLLEPSMTIFRRVFAWAVLCWYAACSSDSSVGDEAVREMHRIARDEGFHLAERFACIIGFFYDMDHGDLVSGRNRIARFDDIFLREQPYEAASIVNMKAYEGMFTGDPERTLRFGPQAAELYETAGSIPHILVGLSDMVWATVELDRPDADLWKARHRQYSSRRNMRFYEWALDAGDAVMALRGGDETGIRYALARVFARDRGLLDQYGHMLSWCRAWASRLADAALSRDIEVPRVLEYIRTYSLAPPPGASARWPWPVRVRVLGHFEIEVDGRTLSFQGKVPRKPLALLKLLAADHGPGIRDTNLVDLLWSAEEADAAFDAFRVALHRLRRLLGSVDAVLVNDGHVSLNPAVCWVDVHALRAAVADSGAADAAGAQREVDRALDLYQGELLEDEDDLVSYAQARTRLAADVERKVLDLMLPLEHECPRERFVELAERAFRRFPGSTHLAEVLMRVHLEDHRPHAALDVHERHLEKHRSTGGDIRTSDGLRRLYASALAADSAETPEAPSKRTR